MSSGDRDNAHTQVEIRNEIPASDCLSQQEGLARKLVAYGKDYTSTSFEQSRWIEKRGRSGNRAQLASFNIAGNRADFIGFEPTLARIPPGAPFRIFEPPGGSRPSRPMSVGPPVVTMATGSRCWRSRPNRWIREDVERCCAPHSFARVAGRTSIVAGRYRWGYRVPHPKKGRHYWTRAPQLRQKRACGSMG